MEKEIEQEITATGETASLNASSIAKAAAFWFGVFFFGYSLWRVLNLNSTDPIAPSMKEWMVLLGCVSIGYAFFKWLLVDVMVCAKDKPQPSDPYYLALGPPTRFDGRSKGMKNSSNTDRN